MPASHCSKCGERLELPSLYCGNCGASIKGTILRDDFTLPQPATKSGTTAARVEGAGATRQPEAEKLPFAYLVKRTTLNAMLSCSFRNAPLDTEFLLLINEAQDWCQMVPLDCIHDLRGLEVAGTSYVRYSLPDADFQIPRNCWRNTVNEEVRQAFLKALDAPTLTLSVTAGYDPAEWGEIQKSEIAGKWTDCVEGNEESGLKLIGMYTQALMSGLLMKKNLQAFADWLSKEGAQEDQSEEILRSIRLASKQIPDDFPQCLRCIAVTTDPDGKFVNTVLFQEEEEKGEQGGQIKTASGAAKKIMQLSRRGAAPLSGAGGARPNVAGGWPDIGMLQSGKPHKGERKWWFPFGR